MTRTCSICQHPDRGEIDAALVAGTPYRSIAQQHAVSAAAMQRHKAHIPRAISQGHEAKAAAQSLDVVRQLKAINGIMWTLLRRARATGDAGTMLKAADRILRQLELQAKLLGDLDERPQVAVTLLTDPQWLRLFAAIRGVLVRYPGALDEVDRAVAQIEAAEGGSVPA